MIEKSLLIFASLLIAIFGLYVLFNPEIVGKKIRILYSNYPIVRYANKEQLTTRNIFLRIIGLLIIVVGLLGVISIIK